MILIIDNYDSFTYNVAQALEVLGASPVVHRNDSLDVNDVEDLSPAGIVISPGPGRPDTAGISCDAVRRFVGRVPILGICLGHQCIASVFGAGIRRAHSVMHGKISRISHDGSGLFAGLPADFDAVRYHSLAVESLPCELKSCAVSEDGEIMAFCRERLSLYGLQFHPESIATEYGMDLLAAFVRCTGAFA